MMNEYTDKFYTHNLKYINNTLSLRPPQYKSLEIFAKLCDTLSLTKESDLDEELKKVNQMCPTLTSFEREFPSICFALATGIGKTRLMGAFIAYLHYQKGIKNFFVLAPNITIYNKLKDDFGNTASPKYVFKGLDKFSEAPTIIDGDNYNERGGFVSGLYSEVVINIFNIAKLTADSKSEKGAPARLKRLSEYLGQSYFDYLKSLPDLCIFMDESHHYHADKSFETINELQPILGIEMTATPQIQKGSRKIPFKNVVYEYSLAHALNDEQYVKVPTVFTRKDFRPDEYTPEQLDREKINDGVRLHEETKSHLDIYARTYHKPFVKPFVLIVAKDTDHSKQIYDYIVSNDFFDGYYKDKVIQINSSMRGAEKDENIQQLLSLESEENKIEIVIHVNMLKEGWDVTNLYTIIPLRASASETLTEQTIGRGLRLPYGARTGIAEVDRLQIIHHDKYSAIVELAKDTNSLVKRVYYIDDVLQGEDGGSKETVALKSAYDDMTTSDTFARQLAFQLMPDVFETTAVNDHNALNAAEDTIDSNYAEGQTKGYGKIQVEPIVYNQHQQQAMQVAKFVANFASSSIMEAGKQIKTFDAIHDEQTQSIIKKTVVGEAIRKFPEMAQHREQLEQIAQTAIETCVQTITDKVIPIPETVVQPFTEVERGFYDFELDTSRLNWHPSDDTLIGTELREGGNTFEYESQYRALKAVDTPENEVIKNIIVHENIDYTTCADLLYSLVGAAKKHFLTYLSPEEADKVMRDRRKTLADIIYAQMNEHFYRETVNFKASGMRPFVSLKMSFGSKFKADEIYDYRAQIPANEVKSKIYNGFQKACHTLYKFDSNTEKTLAIVLENDNSVIKWLRPSPTQFNLYYGSAGEKRYEPDFVVETAEKIYMVETKASNNLDASDVIEKARVATEYCRAATEWNLENAGKPWEYVVLAHNDVMLNSSFHYLVANKVYMDL